MSRKLSCLAVATLFLLLPTRLLAGGPPWLTVPIDGLNADNTKAVTEQLSAKLKDKLYPPDVFRGVAILQNRDQSYATLYMKEDVRLHDIETALKGTGVSVPRNRLHLFGHAILEIDSGDRSAKQLLAALEALDHVSVAKSETKDGLLLVTVDMPYPPDNQRGESVAWDKFVRGDLSSNQSTRSEPAATPQTLPSFSAFRDIVAKHKATLKDVRWSTEYACRSVGCVAVPATAAVASVKPAKPSPTSD
jgi:hypothetical protein